MQIHSSPHIKDQTPIAVLAALSAANAASSTDDRHKAARHREIARRYAWDDRERRERGRYPLIVVFRLRELENLFAYRYGPTLPDDDAGRHDLYVAASHIFRMGSPEVHIPAWARLWCPWLDKDECTMLIADVARARERWDADGLANVLRLDDATRTLLGIKSIGAIDVTKAKRATRRKKQDAADQRARRAKAGAVPHADSADRTKPWEALGISRRTWYRKQANGTFGTNSSAADRLYMRTTNPCHTAGASPSGESAAAAGLSQSQALAADIVAASKSKTVLHVNRESAFAARLSLHLLKNSKNPFDYPLAALASNMVRAAA